ncbi:MAG: sigma-70 family RNA polymerase sigma factor [Acidimicrobiia bacterium]
MKTEQSTQVADEVLNECYLIAYRVAFKLTGSKESAEDVGIETVSRIIEKHIHEKDYVLAYSAKVASSIIISAWRKDAVAKKYSVKLYSDDQTNSEIVLSALRLDLRKAIAKLPKRQKEVVVLRYLADLSEDQIADFLNISLGTVKSTTHDALKRLKDMVEVTP